MQSIASVQVAQPIDMQSLFNQIGKVDLENGNTSNFNKPLGDGYNINQLVREGGSTVNFGSGMSTSNKKQILDKAVAGDKQELGNTSWYNFPRKSALNSGIQQT
eukprot:CAMPEP_0170479050 /NCGR_PEP_ID=MMETSP0208-20121228/416_1 /TAXON_ID=197538 /ORGANISM="Strombidium inclinatum, Strain S3" /LENGTH=103 /DNA_ID=CAMNT_0010751389 /DNA_START=42 /DNA_END=353 /DNA_ORIENTATION=+